MGSTEFPDENEVCWSILFPLPGFTFLLKYACHFALTEHQKNPKMDKKQKFSIFAESDAKSNIMISSYFGACFVLCYNAFC